MDVDFVIAISEIIGNVNIAETVIVSIAADMATAEHAVFFKHV